MDLNLLSLTRLGGQDQPNSPGLYVPSPPRRSARGRQADRLALFYGFEGGISLAQKQQEQLLQRLAQSYYKTPGTVTAALRSVVETLNDFLLERNLHAPVSGQGTGLLGAVTLRGEALFLALSGSMHAFLIGSKDVQHWYDREGPTRGLGIGKAVQIQYHQASLQLNDTLILTPHPPANWSEITLSGLHDQGPEGLRRRLLSPSGLDFSGVLFQAKTGPGRILVLQPQAQADLLKTAELSKEPSEDVLPQAAAVSAVASIASQSTVKTPAPEQVAAPLTQRPSPQPAPVPQPAPIPEKRKKTGWKLFAAVGGVLGGISRSVQSLARRMLPEEGSLPPSVMAFFAIAVPLVVVTVSMVVYFQRGRAAQFQTYYAQAVQAAGQAQGLTDPQARRSAWGAVIAYLDRAEAYETTPDSQALRAQAQSVFDELEGIQRIDYQPAISGGLPASYEITRLVANENDLYLLNASTGAASRAIPAGQVYELDDGFQCGPGLPAGQVTGPLIDIDAIPRGNELNATLIALDAQGNLLQCIPGSEPVFTALALPPTGWGKPRAFTYNQGNLYVLDPEKNAVWVYWSDEFANQPQFFFSEDVPPLEDVIDLTVDKSDLYLLHEDGHVTLCTFSEMGVSPTHCTDPTPYVDSRPGREGLILIPGTPFTEIQATQPPDPSLYLLDPQSQAIYHFSLRLLTFQRQLLPLNPLPAGSPATAFSTRPDGRAAFLALGNKVYYGGIP